MILVGIAVWVGSQLADAKKPWVIQETVDARAAEGKKPPVRTYREIWVWYGAAGSAALLLLLGGTSRWWARPAKIRLGNAPLFRRGPRVQRFGLVLAGITVVAAVPRLARMDLSFWSDEDWALHAHVWGKFTEQADGSLHFERHPWSHTVFYNERANNHVLQSILSKLCLEGWNALRGYGSVHIEEWTTRVPSLAAGIAGVAAIALWLRQLGHPLAGLIAAATLALHPNHFRYSSEARGYALAMTFLSLSSWMLCKAMSGDSRWRHWILFALFQALALFSFTASIYVLVLLNASVAILLLRRHRLDPAAGAVEALKRWFIVNSISGCLYATIALPTTLQALRYMETSLTFAWKMSAAHYEMLWSRIFTGFDFAASHPANPLDLGITVTSGGLALLLAITILFLVALANVIRVGGWNALLLLAPAAAVGLAIAHGVAKVHAIYPQYFLPAFPAAVAVFALLLAGLGECLAHALHKAESPSARAWMAAPAMAVFGSFVLVFWKGLAVLVSHPTENLRGAAAVTRWKHEKTPYADRSQAMVVSLWRSWEIYDPRLRSDIRTADQLQEVIADARRRQLPLYVVVGHLALAEEQNSGMLEILRDPVLFESMDTLWAPELWVTLWPYRLR